MKLLMGRGSNFFLDKGFKICYENSRSFLKNDRSYFKFLPRQENGEEIRC